MTKENWLPIATIISANILAFATLLAPALAEIVKARINQPKASPVTNQPKNLIRKVAAFLVPSLCIVLEIYLLRNEVNSAAPLDRVAIAFIAGLYASIVAITLMMVFAFCFMRLLSLIGHMVDLHHQHFRMSVFTYEVQKGTTQVIFDELDKLGKRPTIPSQSDSIERMISTIRRMLGLR